MDVLGASSAVTDPAYEDLHRAVPVVTAPTPSTPAPTRSNATSSPSAPWACRGSRGDHAPSAPLSHDRLCSPDKVVVVTAAGGDGHRLLDRPALRRRRRAAVVISDIHERRLGEAAGEARQICGTAAAHSRCSATSPSKDRWTEPRSQAAVDKHGHVDVLVNNAGLGGTSSNLVDMHRRGLAPRAWT